MAGSGGCQPALPGILASGAVFSASPAPGPGLRGVPGRAEAALESGLERCVWGCRPWPGLAGQWGQRAGGWCVVIVPSASVALFRSLSCDDVQLGQMALLRAPRGHGTGHRDHAP